MTMWILVGMSILGCLAIAWSVLGLMSHRRRIAQAKYGETDMMLGDGEVSSDDPFLNAIADDLANLNATRHAPGSAPKDWEPDKVLFDTSLDEIVLKDVAPSSDDPATSGDWARPGAPVQMMDFDTCEDGLVLIWDDTKGAKPTISVQRDDVDSSKVNVLLDAQTVAQVACDAGITVDAVALVPLSSADGARWAAA